MSHMCSYTHTLLVFLIIISQYVNERSQVAIDNQIAHNYSSRISEDNYLQTSPGGEYRSRTDDLLRARQAL